MIPMLLFAAVQAAPAGTEPRLRNPEAVFKYQDYPAASLRQNVFGIVSFLLTIATDGTVTACVISETSHFAALDAQTCKLIKSRARFDPARNAGGGAVAGEYRGAAMWGLDNHMPRTTMEIELKVPALPAGYARPTKARLTFDYTGHAATCEITTESGSGSTDQSLCAYAFRHVTIPGPKSGSREVESVGVRYVTAALSVAPAPAE